MPDLALNIARQFLSYNLYLKNPKESELLKHPHAAGGDEVLNSLVAGLGHPSQKVRSLCEDVS